jgi:hypothetical protein
MTARPIAFELVLAGVASLLVASSGLAETRLLSDPNGVVVPTAPADSPRCCANGQSADNDAGAAAAASIPNPAEDVARFAPSAPGGDTAAPSPALDPSVAVKVDLFPPAAAPQSGWRQFLSSIVQEAATNR